VEFKASAEAEQNRRYTTYRTAQEYLENAHEVDEILFFLRVEVYLKTAVVEVDNVSKIFSRAI
jgi:hypothetical protein